MNIALEFILSKGICPRRYGGHLTVVSQSDKGDHADNSLLYWHQAKAKVGFQPPYVGTLDWRCMISKETMCVSDGGIFRIFVFLAKDGDANTSMMVLTDRVCATILSLIPDCWGDQDQAKKASAFVNQRRCYIIMPYELYYIRRYHDIIIVLFASICMLSVSFHQRGGGGWNRQEYLWWV